MKRQVDGPSTYTSKHTNKNPDAAKGSPVVPGHVADPVKLDASGAGPEHVMKEVSSEPYMLTTSKGESFAAALQRHNDAGSYTAEQLLLYVKLSSKTKGPGDHPVSDCSDAQSPKATTSATTIPVEAHPLLAENGTVAQNLLGTKHILCPFVVDGVICCERKRALKQQQAFHIDELHVLGEYVTKFAPSVTLRKKWFTKFLDDNKQKFHKCRTGKDLIDKARTFSKWWPLSKGVPAINKCTQSQHDQCDVPSSNASNVADEASKHKEGGEYNMS